MSANSPPSIASRWKSQLANCPPGCWRRSTLGCNARSGCREPDATSSATETRPSTPASRRGNRGELVGSRATARMRAAGILLRSPSCRAHPALSETAASCSTRVPNSAKPGETQRHPTDSAALKAGESSRFRVFPSRRSRVRGPSFASGISGKARSRAPPAPSASRFIRKARPMGLSNDAPIWPPKWAFDGLCRSRLDVGALGRFCRGNGQWGRGDMRQRLQELVLKASVMDGGGRLGAVLVVPVAA